MIRFVDLNTGNTFDGSSPYIFWLDGEQSINMIYSKPICFISHTEKIEVKIENNDIFSLIDPTNLINSEIETIYDFEYHNLQDLKTTEVISIGVSHHNYYVHIIYILGTATQAGEYICDLIIDNSIYKIGGDFYGENESLYINLANNGVEIPEMIQKALYDVNIHEEKRDNIILNRKWKELLSNFWDVVANKGSYKSLVNSLKWFEYGDSVKIYEIWKNVDTNKYFTKDIQQILSDKYSESLNGFAKTTYIALYHALEQPKKRNNKIIFDTEQNPILEYIASKWSTQDLALKLCLLGNFYETYFMPIHLDLMHSTIEDIVYTNTFKVRQGSIADRSDYIYYCEDIQCNVKDNDIYQLDLIECYVCPDTLFGSKYDQGVTIIGVQKEPASTFINDQTGELRNYVAQLYKEIGAIVEFDITIPNTTIKREVLCFKTYSNSNWEYKTVVDYKLLTDRIKFCLFCPIEGEYDVRLQFDSIDGKIFTKRVKFNVIDTKHASINVYKIQNLGILDYSEIGQLCQINDYLSTRRKYSSNIPNIQYIPAKITKPFQNHELVYNGICLNHLLILNINQWDVLEIEKIVKPNYFTLQRLIKDNDGNTIKTYLICISREFGYKPTDKLREQLIEKINDKSINEIYREDYIFIPEFHKLIPLIKPDNIYDFESYKITDFDALCIIPDLTYGKNIEEYDWEFINVSKPNSQPIQLNAIKEPFIANNQNSPLEPGYYNIKFHYRLTNENKINTISLDSAFIKI